VGSIASPFRKLLISSTGDVGEVPVTQYYLSKESGYSSSSYWKTIVYTLNVTDMELQ